jgi:membrane associated rhomboid family serine protease
MAWNDRSYYRDQRQVHFGGGFSRFSIVTWLIISNAIVFVLGSVLAGAMRGSYLSPYEWGAFSIADGVYRAQIWRWITFQFLHADIFHIFFNMLALYFFGPMLEQWWGRGRFLAFYLACGLAGALLFVVMAMIPGFLDISAQSSLIGASGGVFGVLVGCAVIAPNQRVMLLFPPIPMKMRTLVLVFLGIAVFSVLVGARNGGGEAAHLGGAALGFVLMKKPRLISWLQLRRLRAWRGTGRWQRQQRRLAEEEEEINRILEKVKDHGLHSLSRREKKILQRETDRLRSAG